MSDKYICIDYVLLPDDITAKDISRLDSLMSETQRRLVFTEVGSKQMVVPQPGDLIDYKSEEQIKHPGEFKLREVYEVVVRKFYLPNQEENMVRIGLKRVKTK